MYPYHPPIPNRWHMVESEHMKLIWIVAFWGSIYSVPLFQISCSSRWSILYKWLLVQHNLIFTNLMACLARANIVLWEKEQLLFKGRWISIRLVVCLNKGRKVINPEMPLTYIICDGSNGSKTVSWTRTVLKPGAIAFIQVLYWVLFLFRVFFEL